MFWGGWFWELHIPINLQGVQSSYASFFCVARVSEILGGWERVITEGWGSEEGIMVFCIRGWDDLGGVVVWFGRAGWISVVMRMRV
jgi:hypothetical protein